MMRRWRPDEGARRRSAVLGCLVALVLATGWSAPAASATTLDRFRSTQPYDEVRWDCGYPMHRVGAQTDTVVVRASKQIDGWVMVTDAYSFEETWTAADGRSFTMTGNGVGRDLPGKPVGDSTYEFTYRNPGLNTITDQSGSVVYRDRGQVTYTFTIDFASGTFTFLGATTRGPHPIFDVEMCKAVAPLVGTTSAEHLTARPIGSTSFSMGYYEYLPPSYHMSGTPSPLLVALNGYGENGDGTANGLGLLLVTGIPRFINVGGWPTDRPLVVLALQHVQGSSDIWCTTADEVHDFIAYAVANYNIDPARVYVTGLSCGAIGAWDYLGRFVDEQVAAAVPIAGDGRAAWATRGCDLAAVPIWAFHGELDDVVDPLGSIEPMSNLAACPGATGDTARLTIYPGLYHDGWDQAYSGSLGDDIYTWMLGFTKN